MVRHVRVVAAVAGMAILFGGVAASDTAAIVNDQAQADLSIYKDDNPDPVFAGDPLIYTIGVTNGGPDVANETTVSDPLPAQMIFKFASTGCTYGPGGIVTCQLGNISAGQGAEVQITVEPTQPNQSVINSACADTTSTDPSPHDCDSETTTVLARPTAVRIVGAAAVRTREGVLLRWRSTSEAQLLGFNVYRGRGRKLVRLNPRVIAPVALSGHVYSWLDRRAPRSHVQYRIQAVDLSGARSWVASVACGGRSP